MTIRSIVCHRVISLLGVIFLITGNGTTAANGQTANDRPAPEPRFSRPSAPLSATVVARYRPDPQTRWAGRLSAESDRLASFSELPAGPELPPALPAEATPRYWIVSSRRLPQELPWTGGHQMEVFERRPDGPLSRSDLATLRCQLVPGVPVCVFVHGTFVSAEWHQQESARTYEWVRQTAPHLPLHVIFFTWPSDADTAWLSPILVNLRGQWAENNGFYLAELIANFPPESPVCLVGHSHGGRAVASTLHLLGGGQVGGYTLPFDPGPARRMRAVFAAAAFDRHWLNPGQRYDRALCRTEGILNLRNSNDLALHIYPLRRPFSRQAIGDTGFTLWDRARLGPFSIRAIDLDVAPFIGFGHTWFCFYDEPRIAHAMTPYVYFVAQ